MGQRCRCNPIISDLIFAECLICPDSVGLGAERPYRDEGGLPDARDIKIIEMFSKQEAPRPSGPAECGTSASKGTGLRTTEWRWNRHRNLSKSPIVWMFGSKTNGKWIWQTRNYQPDRIALPLWILQFPPAAFPRKPGPAHRANSLATGGGLTARNPLATETICRSSDPSRPVNAAAETADNCIGISL